MNYLLVSQILFDALLKTRLYKFNNISKHSIMTIVVGSQFQCYRAVIQYMNESLISASFHTIVLAVLRSVLSLSLYSQVCIM